LPHPIRSPVSKQGQHQYPFHSKARGLLLERPHITGLVALKSLGKVPII